MQINCKTKRFDGKFLEKKERKKIVNKIEFKKEFAIEWNRRNKFHKTNTNISLMIGIGVMTELLNKMKDLTNTFINCNYTRHDYS